MQPRGKTRTHNSKTLARNQLRNRCLYVLWRQDFILSGTCKLKTRTHMGGCAATWENLQPQFQCPWLETVEDQMPGSLVATRFHLVEGKCKLENSHPHGKTCTHMGKLAPTWENSHPHGKTCSTFWRWHQSGHGFRKLIRLLENAVTMAV